VAHELGLQPPAIVLDRPVPQPAAAALARALLSDLNLRTDGTAATCNAASYAERLERTQTVRWTFSCEDAGPPRTLTIDGPLFPYDPEHQTFVNVYVDGALAGQATLDRLHRRASFAVGTPSRAGTFRRFLMAGIQHILSGPDHLLFLAGLLLTGGGFARLAAIVTAFTVTHSVTLALAVLGVVTPPPRLIEPLIALSIVYVGLRNLRPAKSGDWRTISAGLFGLIHGFGFAYALREMQLPRPELALSLLSFNLGVETGQIGVVIVVVLLLTAVRQSGWLSERRLVVSGALVVTAAGTIWFIERMLLLWR
jgi:hydrogenase/urease accessory protein HupE